VLLPRAQWQEETRRRSWRIGGAGRRPRHASHLEYLGQDVAYIGSLAWLPDAVDTARFEQITRRLSPEGERRRPRPLAVELVVLEPMDRLDALGARDENTGACSTMPNEETLAMRLSI
jgi:hypothetical protein